MADEPRVTSVTVRVRDLKASARFYSDLLGLDLGTSHGHGDGHDPWDATDHVEAMWGTGEEDGFWFVVQELGPGIDPTRGEFGFRFPDFDAALSRARDAGATVLHEPRAMPWGTREARVADPDGNVVVISG